jgi:hypothetical protein
LHLFTKFCQNCFCGLGVKELFSIFYPTNCHVTVFFLQNPCQIKSFSLITMKIRQHHPKGRPHTQYKFECVETFKKIVVTYQVSFLYCKKVCNFKCFSPMTKNKSSKSAQGQAPHTVKISVHCNFYKRCNYNIQSSPFISRALYPIGLM